MKPSRHGDRDDAWFRLCVAIDGFRARHGRWPTRVRLDGASMESIRRRLESSGIPVAGKVGWVVDGSSMIAEDDRGGRYDFGEEGSPPHRPIPGATEWLGGL